MVLILNKTGFVFGLSTCRRISVITLLLMIMKNESKGKMDGQEKKIEETNLSQVCLS